MWYDVSHFTSFSILGDFTFVVIFVLRFLIYDFFLMLTFQAFCWCCYKFSLSLISFTFFFAFCYFMIWFDIADFLDFSLSWGLCVSGNVPFPSAVLLFADSGFYVSNMLMILLQNSDVANICYSCFQFLILCMLIYDLIWYCYFLLFYVISLRWWYAFNNFDFWFLFKYLSLPCFIFFLLSAFGVILYLLIEKVEFVNIFKMLLFLWLQINYLYHITSHFSYRHQIVRTALNEWLLISIIKKSTNI